jgi:S-methylmethionine-dependent homocysteine/selenocysteine methylase
VDLLRTRVDVATEAESRQILAALNRRAVAFKAELREAWEQPGAPMPISACIGRSYAALLGAFRAINVVGGCCGTDHRHVAQAARFCAPVAA